MVRVLVVDDELDQLRLLLRGLELEGFVPFGASSAAEAMGVLRREEVALALVDLMMPGTNGLELARLIHGMLPTLPIALMSAYRLSEAQIARANCGVVGLLPKPCGIAELGAFLRSKLTAASRPLVTRAS
jgi:DNA-binding response OmpR family regulator